METIISAIFDNIGFIVGMLIIIASIGFSSRKRRNSGSRQGTDPADTGQKSFKDLMAEIETQLEREGEGGKPFAAPETSPDPYRPEPAPRRRKQTGKPWRERASVPPESQKAEAALVAAEEPVKPAEPERQTVFSGGELVNAVIMSEILGKPKAMQ